MLEQVRKEKEVVKTVETVAVVAVAKEIAKPVEVEVKETTKPIEKPVEIEAPVIDTSVV